MILAKLPKSDKDISMHVLYIVGPIVGVGLVTLAVVLIKRGSFDFRNDYYKLTGNFSTIFLMHGFDRWRQSEVISLDPIFI